MRPILALLAVLAATACEDEAKPDASVPARRADKVPAGSATKESPSPAPKPTAAPTPERELCAGQSDRDTPEPLEVGRAVEGDPPGKLSYGERWVWINVWAAWCGPCKKELPMLLEWRKRLRKAGVELELAFVSIDDDEREMTRFLSEQPASGMKATYWLSGDEARSTFFESLGYDDTPTLPVHAFVSPSGKLTCTVEGALEDADYDRIAELLGA